MNRITEVRNAIYELFSDVEYEKKVLMAPTDLTPGQTGGTFGGAGEPDTNYILRIMAGPAEEATENAIDDLLMLVANRLRDDRTMGGSVSHAQLKHCSGHRLYSGAVQGSPPSLGCEWTIKVMD